MSQILPTPPPIDGYRAVKYLGSGGFGEVFRYEHTATLAAVAVKVLRDGLLAAGGAEQLLHEAQALGRLSTAGPHPNIVAIQDVGRAGGRPYLMMEYCPGGSWAELIAKQGRLHPSKVLSVGIQIAGALYMAHQVGIVHRDIKPGNILIGANVGGQGIPKLADFGIAAVSAQELARGSAWLSPDYAAPEVVESGEADELSDLFSLAATLYHALAGRTWVQSPGKASTIGSDVPESLEWLLRVAMSSDRKVRGRSVPDAREFALRLRDIQFELHYDRTPVPIEEPGEHTGPRPPVRAETGTGQRQPRWASRSREHAAVADTDVRPRPVAAAPAPRRRRWWGVAGVAGAVAVVVVGAAFAINTLASPSGKTNTSQPTSAQAGDPAVPERQPVPVPTVQGNRVDADSVEFTWIYADPQPGDTFRLLRTGQPAIPLDEPKWTVDGVGPELCVEVMVVRQDRRTTTTGGRACA